MADAEKQRDELLQNAGARLIRKSRHPIYQFPNGRTFVTPATPSDYRGARNSLAALRRILAAHAQLAEAAPELDQLCELAEETRSRVRVPNRPPRETTDERIITFVPDRSVTQQDTHAQQTAVPFTGIKDVFIDVAAVPGFWDLDSCGRLRVLDRFIRQFAKVEALPYRHCSILLDDAKVFSEDRTSLLFDRLEEAWPGRRRAPCLLVHDDLLGDIVIEVEATRTHGGVDNITALGAEFSNGFYLHLAKTREREKQSTEEAEAAAALVHVTDELGQMRLNPAFETVRTQIDSVLETIQTDLTVNNSSVVAENHILYEFMDKSGAKKYGIRFQTTESWTNPNLIRSVIRKVLQIRQDRGHSN